MTLQVEPKMDSCVCRAAGRKTSWDLHYMSGMGTPSEKELVYPNRKAESEKILQK